MIDWLFLMEKFICEFCNSTLTCKENRYWYCSCKPIKRTYCESYFFQYEYDKSHISFPNGVAFELKQNEILIYDYSKGTESKIKTDLFSKLFENEFSANEENVSSIMFRCKKILDNLIFE